MSSLRNVNNLGTTQGSYFGSVGYAASFSVFHPPVKEIQSLPVTSSGFLWQEVLTQMTWEEAGLNNSRTVITDKETLGDEELRKREALLGLLDSWSEKGDEQEQRETLEYLKQVLDEDRLSDRKLFS